MERGRTVYLKTMKDEYTNSKCRESEDLQMPQVSHYTVEVGLAPFHSQQN